MVIALLVLLFIFFFSKPTLKTFYLNQLKKHLAETGEVIKPQATKLYQDKSWNKLQEYIKTIGINSSIRITVINLDGKVMADSQNDPAAMDNHANRPEIHSAINGDAGHSIRFSATMGEEMLYVATPVEKDGSALWVLRLSLFFSDIKVLILDLQKKLFTLVVVLFFLSLLMAYFFSRSIANPIKEIARATQKFAQGDYDVKLFLPNRDELHSVAENFNQMVDEKRLLFTRMSENKEELQAIITAMREGLLLLDQEGKILLFNQAFAGMWQANDVKGRPYWEIIRIPDFEIYVEKGKKTPEGFYQEVEHNGKHILVGFNTIKQGEKLLITFRDITEFKQLEKIKKDFIINLTHELKTPLTAIKGFVETLEIEEENITHQNYIDIIKRHANRMNQIILDLMTLSELEEKKAILDLSSINLKDLLDNIINMFKDQIKKKKLKLKVDIKPDSVKFQGERFKIEQLLINLIDNAVKYTEKGSITILAEESNENITIKIKDTGIGIPAESVPRIFERFYVVDKSRARKLGGTGLGLSIVKHIVQLHRGWIEVDSEPNQGTTFTITFPK
jgi:two-component system phosphate regulon sensor histidine kinase PhoR